MTSANHARIWLPAAVMGLVVAALTVVAGHFLLQAGMRHSAPILEEATRTGAAAVGEAVAGQFARALELGIPLDRLDGVDAYLRRIAEGSPQVGGFALLDETGRVIAATAPGIDGETFEIAANGARASLVVSAVSPLIDDAMRRIWISLALAALLAGMVAAALTGGYLGLSWQPSRDRLLRAVGRAGDGDFSAATGNEASGPFHEASLALSRNVERVHAARRKLAEAVSTIRAIDFDGSLGRRVDAILQPLDGRYILPDQSQGEYQAPDRPSLAAGAIWRIAAVGGLYAAAFPFVANFALDRGAANIPAAWLGTLPLLAELVALVVGALVGATLRGRNGAVLPLALVLLAVATGATFWCRDYGLFVVLRCGAGFAAGVALASLLGHAGVWARPRVLSLALLFATLCAAPLLAGLLAEAVGRRTSFLLIGLLVMAFAPFLAGMAAETAGKERSDAPAPGFDPSTALCAWPAAAFALVLAPLGIGYDNYLVGAGAVAMMGLAALAAPPLLGLATGAALAAAALLLHQAPGGDIVSTYAASAAMGLALGGALAAARSRPLAIRSALAVGAAAGLLTAGALGQFGVSPAAAVAAAALLSAIPPLLRRRSRSMPGGS